ncbi:hypothetical protein HMPREF9069_00622 [Atopobium sp. oral taxon 810 str. F0209]|nr:hypothetical protein HMPREF9069_00622 [Atopobium sp. oral taxon 810 str. F0209]
MVGTLLAFNLILYQAGKLRYLECRQDTNHKHQPQMVHPSK